MKRALLVALVVVVVVTGLPLAMGMGGMAFCPECGPAVLARAAECLPAAVLVSAVVLTPAFAGRLRLFEPRLWPSLFTTVLERPPRTA
ncbi:MAG: hypothetical protein ACRD1D_09605 [Acidimicrobiales bacterium]